jgi:Xaa-Pro aminopeptidase
VSSPLPAPYDARIERVRREFKERGIQCLLVSSRENVRYLVGFSGSAGWVLVTDADIVLATDARYIEQVRLDLGNSCTRLADAGLNAFAVSYVATCEAAVLGFEAEHLSYAGARTLENAIELSGACCEVRPTEGIVEGLRAVKDDGELAAMAHAAALADGALARAREVVRCGMTEHELAWELEKWMREHGSGPVPFGIIVASGPNAALPHATPGERQFAAGEPIVIDLGATWGGYCSDLTRTLFPNHMPPPFDSVYATVLSAHMAALQGARAGMRMAEVDGLARRVMVDAGFADRFTHGLGHGVGLEIHERPAVSSRSTDILLDRMVFTIEPGIYLPGQGGVRIEDTVVMLEGMPRSFSHSDKENPVV